MNLLGSKGGRVDRREDTVLKRQPVTQYNFPERSERRVLAWVSWEVKLIELIIAERYEDGRKRSIFDVTDGA